MLCLEPVECYCGILTIASGLTLIFNPPTAADELVVRKAVSLLLQMPPRLMDDGPLTAAQKLKARPGQTRPAGFVHADGPMCCAVFCCTAAGHPLIHPHPEARRWVPTAILPAGGMMLRPADLTASHRLSASHSRTPRLRTGQFAPGPAH